MKNRVGTLLQKTDTHIYIYIYVYILIISRYIYIHVLITCSLGRDPLCAPAEVVISCSRRAPRLGAGETSEDPVKGPFVGGCRIGILLYLSQILLYWGLY